uniref:C2 domain-containing protein n=1 Tax=Oncorhynchus tshawytscha TaxID=74940 RepID=A0AAZ3R1Y4_ONCTS
MGGLKKGKSDPYVKINIGGVKFKSHVIKENLNPTWNEMYETVMTPQSDQEVQVELYDKDMDKDDFLGRCNISMRDIIHSQYTDQWYTLNDVKSGRLHLVLEWVPTVSQPDRLDQVLQLQSLQSYQNKAVPSAALLFVYMDRAHSLPLKKSGKEPKAGAELVLGETTYRTKVCDRTNSPQWEEAFYFLVRDPREEILIVKLSSAWDQAMGSLVVTVRELLSEPDLVLDHWLSLDEASPDSQILLRAELKILNSKMTEGVGVPQGSDSGPETITSWSYSEEEEPITIEQPVTATIEEDQDSEVPSVESVAVSSQPSISKEDPSPPETLHTPDPSFETEKEEPEEPITVTQLSITADTEELQPWQGPTAGSVTEDIARATVSSLPSVSVPEEAEVMPDVIPETRPPHTTPHPSFGTEGVLRIHVLEAQDLVAMDKLMGGLKKGKSDPYVKINIGVVKFKSRVIKENLNPTWNEMFETVLNPQAGQEVQVELYDKDMDADDFLGRCAIGYISVFQWYTLNDVKSGRLHLVLEWVPTVSQPDRLNKVLQLQSLQSYQNKAVPSAALLFVYMDRAHSLPLKKSGKEPKAGAELVLGETTYRTKVCERTNSPQWEEAFYFLVRDPREEILIVKLSSAWDQAMGSLVVPVRELLSEPDLVLDQWLSLDGASPDSQILLRAELKVRHIHKHVPTINVLECGTKCAQPIQKDIARATVSSLPSVSVPEEAEVMPDVIPETRPPHTTPHPSFGTEGVLRIHVLEAQDLVAMDKLMGGLKKGKSDPYVKINIGVVKFKSRVIKENLNPTWNEMFETVLNPQAGQEVQVELYDKDMDADDFLGRCAIGYISVFQWYTLNDVKSGRLHLVLEWVPTVSQPDRLNKVLQLQSLQSYQNKAVPSAALLFVYMDRAHSLPLKQSGKEPKAGAELVLGETTYRTKVCERTNSPQWEEAFYFLVRDPREEILIVKLSSAWDQAMGSLVVPVRELLSEPDLVLDQWLSLDGASPDSQILLRAELKVRHIHKHVPTINVLECGTKCAQPIQSAALCTLTALSMFLSVTEDIARATVSSLPSVSVPEEAEVMPDVIPETRPPHTTPHPRFGTEGVLRIHVLEAQDLVAMDKLMGGLKKGKSDPYVKINIGVVKFKSRVIKENLNPTWNEMFETVLNPQAGQEVQVELYDKDMDADDFLGRSYGYISVFQWYTLNDVKSGRLHLVLEWVPTVSQPDRLDQVLQLQSLQSYQNKAVPSAALLFVYMDRAHSLPMKKSGKEPKAGAELVLGETTYRTKVCDRTNSPQWDEAFYFLVRDPKEEMLIVKLSSAWDQAMGSLVVPVRELLSQPDLVLDQWLSLDGASPDSQILLRAELKILESKMVDLIGHGILPCAAGNCGQVKLSLSYASKKKKLTITVHACRDLESSSKDGLDTYVSLMLLPDKNKATKRKTSIKKRDLNPEYNERFEFELSVEEARRRHLSVSVKNSKASFRSSDLFGQVQIELAQIDLASGVTEW